MHQDFRHQDFRHQYHLQTTHAVLELQECDSARPRLATAITRQGSGRIKDQETLRELQDTHPKWTYDKNTPPPKKKKNSKAPRK